MVLKNRSRVEILYDIVAAAKPYGKKTHLMYKGNLSYQQLDLYLDFILKNGLLEERLVEDIKLYYITQKGLEFMRLFEDMHRLLVSKKEGLGIYSREDMEKPGMGSENEQEKPLEKQQEDRGAEEIRAFQRHRFNF